jgi:hypothetical protein
LGDIKPSPKYYGSFVGHPDAIIFSHFLKNRVFPQPVQPPRAEFSAQRTQIDSPDTPLSLWKTSVKPFRRNYFLNRSF